MSIFYLVRHGATDAIGHSFTGQLAGVALNKEGMQQAEAVTERLRDKGIRAVYSSPSERARRTAGVIAGTLGLGVEECSAFHEIDIGEWSGMAFVELDKDSEFHLFNSARSLSRPPGGEMMIEVQTRAVGQLLRMVSESGDDSSVIVTHADVIKTVLAYFLGIPLDLIVRLRIDLGSISLLDLSREHAQVIAVNH